MSTSRDRAILNSIFNPLLPVGQQCFYDVDDEENSQDTNTNPATKESIELELEGVKSAESGNIAMAIECFTQAIAACPNSASGYNNRAQAYRIQGKVNDASSDLDQAILLSGGVGRAGCQSLCQRALIRLAEGKEEIAKQDLQKAADAGSQFAKAQLVQLNPYAALCNKMLNDVIGKLQGRDHLNGHS